MVNTEPIRSRQRCCWRLDLLLRCRNGDVNRVNNFVFDTWTSRVLHLGLELSGATRTSLIPACRYPGTAGTVSGHDHASLIFAMKM